MDRFTTTVSYVYEAESNIKLSKDLIDMLWDKVNKVCGGKIDYEKSVEITVKDATSIIHGLELLNNQLYGLPLKKGNE